MTQANRVQVFAVAGFLLIGMLAVLPANGTAEAGEEYPIRTEDDKVWVKWSAVENLDSKEKLESGVLRFPADQHWNWGIHVHNNHSEPIENVTLVPKMAGADVEFHLFETSAGGPARGDFAFWGELEGKSDNLVIMNFTTPQQVDEFRAHYLVFYDHKGVQKFSKTTYSATGEEKEEDGNLTSETAKETPTAPAMAIFAVSFSSLATKRSLRRRTAEGQEYPVD